MKRPVCMVIALLWGLILSSCWKDDGEDWVRESYPEFHKNYIQRYCDLYEIQCNAFYARYSERPRCYGFCITALGERIASYDGEPFERLAAYHGDENYNQEVWVYALGTAEGPAALADNYLSLHVTSDKDWDGAHPAGTPLDDLLLVEFESHAGFIQSGYTTHSQDEKEVRISELTPADLTTIQSDCGSQFMSLFFLQAPDQDEEHTLTVTLTASDGEVLSCKVRIRPEKYVREK